MYCRKCGAIIPEDAMFCPECGMPVVQEEIDNNANDLNIKKKNKKIYYLLAVVAVVIIGFFGYQFFIKDSTTTADYQIPLDNLVTGIEEKDLDTILSVFPDELYDKYEEEVGIDIRQMGSLFSKTITDNLFSQFDGMDISYTIDNVYDCSNDEVSEIINRNKTNFDIDLNIVAAKRLDITINTVSASDNANNNGTLVVIQVDNEWYLDPTAISSFD